jgi:transitional endoplasmic reticulum ATPase
MATRTVARPPNKARPLDEKTGVETATDNYEPSDEVKALLASHNVRTVPPSERTGAHEVSWSGRNFNIPADPEAMSLRQAAEVLERKADEEEQTILINEVIDALPWDGAQAFAEAVKDLFGWGIWQPKPGFWGPTPPIMRTIKTGPGSNEQKQVFWGELFIPQIEATLSTGMTKHEGRIVFQIQGHIEKRNRFRVETLISLARIYAHERSIYKGKAIRMFVNDKGALDTDKEPEFIKIDPMVSDDLIFSEEVMSQINTNLFAPIQYPQACRRLGVPLKRGVLLSGPYGVGKSMTAAATAKLAVENGWTFIMLDRVGGLKPVLDFAHRYAPVVVFAEDVDSVISGEDRTVSVNDVLNTLDGVQGKAHEIITVLTTNHPEKITHALLRPGRLDAIVTVTPPDAAAAERLMRKYSRGMIADNIPLPNAGKELEGHIPAVIREAVERAKLTAVFRTNGHPTEITDDDLVVAATTMKAHLALLDGPSSPPKSAETRLGEALSEIVVDRIAGFDKESELTETVDKIYKELTD